jgi:hypothetical protein
MGINAEFVELLIELRRHGQLDNCRRIVELGAQDIAATPEVVSALLRRARLGEDPVASAKQLYGRFGIDVYETIDLGGYHGARPLDLNKDLSSQGFSEQFDVVTNLGTLERCFDQAAAFRNMHNPIPDSAESAETCRPADKEDREFAVPCDRIFTEGTLVAASEFRSWIKTSWDNALGFETLDRPE